MTAEAILRGSAARRMPEESRWSTGGGEVVDMTNELAKRGRLVAFEADRTVPREVLDDGD